MTSNKEQLKEELYRYDTRLLKRPKKPITHMNLRLPPLLYKAIVSKAQQDYRSIHSTILLMLYDGVMK